MLNSVGLESVLSICGWDKSDHFVAGTLSVAPPSAGETPTVTLSSDSRCAVPCPASTFQLKLLLSPVALSRASRVAESIAPVDPNLCLF